MAVRLYPNTQVPAVLERLINVPAGTHAQLMEIEAQQRLALEAAPEHERGELGYQQYCELQKNNINAFNLSGFLTFGWGRVASSLCEDYAGAIDFPDRRIEHILKDQGVFNLNGVSLEEMGGVHWS